jgi:uncharacterized iron-regulated membrane protein
MASRVAVQQLWLKIHRWIGLGLLPAFALLGITGSVLVFPDFFERLAHPGRYPDGASDMRVGASAALREASAYLPEGDRPSAIRFPKQGSALMVAGQVRAAPALGLGPPQRAKVWLDPASGKVLSVSDGSVDFLWAMHATHGHMLLQGAGREVIAMLGVVLLVSAGSGLWLWWPKLRHLGRALRWQRHASISMNLHRQSGAIVALILVLETITGIYVAVPALFAPLIERDAAVRQMSEGPAAARTLASPRLDADEALRAAQVALPEGRIESVFLPTEGHAAWTVNLSAEGPRIVRVADADGTACVQPVARPGPARRVEKVMTDLHFGHYGAIWRGIVFLSGVVMSFLVITGPLMWLQGRKRRARRKPAGALAPGP